MDSLALGTYGEDLAAKYLLGLGYRLLARNYRGKSGEIDIIAQQEDYLVFIEVKTRRTSNYGYPYEAVDRRKQEKIIKTSIEYVLEGENLDLQPRYDIIEVYLLARDYRLNHIENAFTS